MRLMAGVLAGQGFESVLNRRRVFEPKADEASDRASDSDGSRGSDAVDGHAPLTDTQAESLCSAISYELTDRICADQIVRSAGRA